MPSWAEAEILDVIRSKVFLIFPPCSFSSTNGFYSPHLSKSGLKLVCNCKHCIWIPQVWELSRLCQETPTKLYVYEFGLWSRVTRQLWIVRFVSHYTACMPWQELLSCELLAFKLLQLLVYYGMYTNVQTVITEITYFHVFDLYFKQFLRQRKKV